MSGIGTYLLVNRSPVPCDNLREWASKMEGSRRVAGTTVCGTFVSTVFLGLDHGFGDDGPLLFETMVFDWKENGNEEYQTRCSTWNRALKMHDEAVKAVQASKPWWKRWLTFTYQYGEKI